MEWNISLFILHALETRENLLQLIDSANTANHQCYDQSLSKPGPTTTEQVSTLSLMLHFYMRHHAYGTRRNFVRFIQPAYLSGVHLVTILSSRTSGLNHQTCLRLGKHFSVLDTISKRKQIWHPVCKVLLLQLSKVHFLRSKLLLGHMVHGAVLISSFLAFNQTPVYTVRVSEWVGFNVLPNTV